MSDYPSVIKVFTTYQSPDYDTPWRANSPSTCTGSGVVIEGGRILTAAHVIADHTFIQVQKTAEPDKRIARVVAVCHECDLGLLEVDDASFFEGIEPVPLGSLPDLRAQVQVVGFPIGGDEIAITEGVVSRVEVQRYTHSQRMLLAVTVDAAINSGNSGGPVFLDGEMVGIAFQSLEEGENNSEIVPIPIVNHFLERARRGSTLGFPALGLGTQTLENAAMRRRVGMKKGQSGVYVTRVHANNSASEAVRPGDVLMSVDGVSVSNNGTVLYAGRYRTHLNALLHAHYIGDRIGLTLLRDGETIEVEITLKGIARLVPYNRYDVDPTFCVYGGLVFQPLTRDFLRTWRKWSKQAPKELLYHYYYGVTTDARMQAVCFTQVLDDAINVGYRDFTYTIIDEVNGVKVRDMSHFAALLEAAEGTLTLKTTRDHLIVFDVDEVRASKERIHARYHVAADRSADLVKEGSR